MIPGFSTDVLNNHLILFVSIMRDIKAWIRNRYSALEMSSIPQGIS